MSVLLGKLTQIREMAEAELQEAVDAIPASVPTFRIVSKFLYSKYGKFHAAFDAHTQHHLKHTPKLHRPALLQQMKRKYSAVGFTIAGKPFYANIEHIDAVLSILRSLHETDTTQDSQ